MKIEVLVASVTPETWFRGEKDERQVFVVNCLDRGASDALRFKQTFDYQPSMVELEELDLTKLDGLMVKISVNDITSARGGRIKMKGMLDRASLPKDAIKAGQSVPSVPPKK